MSLYRFYQPETPCFDCADGWCTMNCGPVLKPHGTAPKKVWVIYPDDGGAPVLWTEPCPFPVEDGTVVEYLATEHSQTQQED